MNNNNFKELAKDFVILLEISTEEKRKAIIEGIPIKELRNELKKCYGII